MSPEHCAPATAYDSAKNLAKGTAILQKTRLIRRPGTEDKLTNAEAKWSPQLNSLCAQASCNIYI